MKSTYELRRLLPICVTTLTMVAHVATADAFTAHAADNSPLAHLSFQRSLQPGVRDPNGKLITGTEIDFLVPHQGRLYASNCLVMETDPSVPKACQILVLDSPKGQWRVDREFTVNSFMMRCSILKEITFATDGRGQAIAPVSLLLAVPDARRGALKVFCRDDASGDWSASVLGTVTGAIIRAMGLHRDTVTRIDRIFAGTNKGVVGGVYDPAAPGRIRWDKAAEVENPVGERVMAFCDCNGILYGATSRHIFRRTDGSAPAWKEVYFSEKEKSPSGIRGLSAVPSPTGRGGVLLFASLGKIRRLDPADGFKETVELRVGTLLTEKLGLPVTGALSAYNDFLPYAMPGTGETLWLFGFECFHPLAVVNANPRIKAHAQMGKNAQWCASGNGRYCIRHAKGADITYEAADITDPREPQLVATRTIAVSPFAEDQGKAIYFGGYDCNGVPSHNTAWVYRGELADKTTIK